ncbi:MAG: GNAT family N-acetyltransferase [Stigonema ocellatum SAG 48.90 = DSM 106950]|nr:GNAT family N-acetyltransferase [Stigonema ocellatum SAG 48.90 = DSM 106950]
MAEVTIRAFEMADWEDVAALFNAPICRWGTMQMPYQSRDEIKRKLENPPPGLHRIVAVLNAPQKVIGMISLHAFQGRRSHVGSLGIFVHDDYHNQGIGSQLMQAVIDLVFNWLNLKRLELTVYTDNQSAVHLYEKYGFVIEGTMQKYAFRDGAYIDAYTMARLRN